MGKYRHGTRQFGSIVTQSDLRRPAPDRQPRATILIVCEGKKTEPTYFRALCTKLRLTTVEVEIVGNEKGSAPISVVNHAIDLRNNRASEAASSTSKLRFDKVWCVFDTEEPGKNKTLAQAAEKAKANKLDLAVSNPCFEYWILLHFTEPGTSFHRCAEVISEIKKHLPSYNKGSNHFPQLDPRTKTAIERSRKQFKITRNLPDRWLNPITHVHKLVETLQEVASQ